ncbi:excinuclease UvrABC ATPase subunit [Arthrobacter sp. UYEF21]
MQNNGKHADLLGDLTQAAFSRVLIDGVALRLSVVAPLQKQLKHDITAIVDRLVAGSGVLARLTDSIETALRKWWSRYLREIPCRACGGSRLRPEVLAVTVGARSIGEVAALRAGPVHRADRAHPTRAADQRSDSPRILVRVTYLLDVGLNYLSLSRAAGTLSSGETQRIRLAAQVGTGLSGVLYVLDEPSIKDCTSATTTG